MILEWFLRSLYPITLFLSIMIITLRIYRKNYLLKTWILNGSFLCIFFVPIILPFIPNISNFTRVTVEIQKIKNTVTLDTNSFVYFFIYFWLTLSFVFVMYHLISYIYIKYVWVSKQLDPPHQIRYLFEKLQKRHDSYYRVEVKITAESFEPGVVGCFFPIIIIPEKIIESFTLQELELLLLHELSHVRRWDSFFIFFQRLCESLYFFHPFLWHLSQTLNDSREICCDIDVINETTKRKEYARVIIKTIESKKESQVHSKFALGYFSSVKQRLHYIVNNAPKKSSMKDKICCLIMALFFIFCLSLWGNPKLQIYRRIMRKEVALSTLHVSTRKSFYSLTIGKKTTYTIEAHNKGNVACTNIKVENIIGSHVKVVNVIANCNYQIKNNKISFESIGLLPKEKAIFKITVRAINPGYSKNRTLIQYNEFNKIITVEENTQIKNP